jgi:hypothetical protein
MTLVRRRVIRRGINSNRSYMRLMALLLVGRPALLRQNALRQGFFGNDKLWKTLGYMYLANDIFRKVAVKEPERLGIERLVAGQSVTITALSRSSRRAARAARAS